MSSSPILIAMILATSVGFPSHGKAAESKPAERIAFRVLCSETRGEVISVLPPKGNSSEIVIPLYVGSFSELITAKFADRKAEFFADEKQPNGKTERKLVAEGPLARGLRQAFLVVPSNDKSGPVYRIIAFDDSDGAFPMGSTRTLNLTPFPIRLNVAGKDHEPIKPGETGTYPLCKTVDEWNMYSVGIDIGIKEREWQRIATQSWKASDGKRDWVIISYDAESKQPTVQLYQDIPPWMTVDLSPKGRKSSKSKK